MLKGRTEHFADPIRLSIKNDIPGPGIYGVPHEMNSTGNYPLSTMENSKAATWSPSKKDRTQDASYIMRNNPGPGKYNPSDYNEGLYITSKFKNRGTYQYKNKVVKKIVRTKAETEGTPGPGSYIAPSDFGHLDLKMMFNNPD